MQDLLGQPGGSSGRWGQEGVWGMAAPRYGAAVCPEERRGARQVSPKGKVAGYDSSFSKLISVPLSLY